MQSGMLSMCQHICRCHQEGSDAEVDYPSANLASKNALQGIAPGSLNMSPAVVRQCACCAGTVNNTTTAMVLYSENNESVEWINMCWRKVWSCMVLIIACDSGSVYAPTELQLCCA